MIFNIEYRADNGQRLVMEFSLGHTGDKGVIDMYPVGDAIWRAELPLNSIDGGEVRYKYMVVDTEGLPVRKEQGSAHRWRISGDAASAEIYDQWRDSSHMRALLSSAFLDCICKRDMPTPSRPLEPGFITLAVTAPSIPSGGRLLLVGDHPSLGSWNPEFGLPMTDGDFPRWSINIPAPLLSGKVEFKFVVSDSENRKTFQWESGDNRILDIGNPAYDKAMAIDCGHLRHSGEHILSSGTAIPVFSIRTNDDFGTGDFHTLRKMIDWMVATNQKVLQILPVNDTIMTHGIRDSYPYNAISSFALHPLYLHLQSLGTIDDVSRRKDFEKQQKELNSLPTLDYPRVVELKMAYAREIFLQQGNKIIESAEYRDFASQNSSWLIPYTAFSILRDVYGTARFADWCADASYSTDLAQRVVDEHRKEADFIGFVQYHLDRQLRETHDYARSMGIALKGDIPIGISPSSADAWQSPELFNLGMQAGAPPDAFARNGQNWGFPTYNWDRMSLDNYGWWRRRFQHMERYFDAYRIDHVLGFFRIWEIPSTQVHGLLGHFSPALPLSPGDMSRDYGFEFNLEQHTLPPYDKASLLPEGVKTQSDVCRMVNDIPLREQYLDILDDVLFIEDPYEAGHYHPRIEGRQTTAYALLTDDQKIAFDRLYQDFFYERHNELWAETARRRLGTISQASKMLVCAEDLGMIPACVPQVLKELGILSLKIQRMPDTMEEFGQPDTYPYLSVCSTSTHDMPGIRFWWEEDPARARRYFDSMLNGDGTFSDIATPNICSRILANNLDGASMLCIFPLQDWLSADATLRRDNPADEVINVPSDPDNYWNYRMHITVEKLLEANQFNAYIRRILADSHR